MVKGDRTAISPWATYWATAGRVRPFSEAGRVPLTGPSAVMPDLAKENYKVPKQFP